MNQAHLNNTSALERYQIILPLLGRAMLPNAVLEKHGRRVGISGRTLRRWIDRYRAGGLDALAASQTHAARQPRVLDQECSSLIHNAYLQPTSASVAAVHRQVVEARVRQGKPAPSYSTVWRFCVELPAEEACLAREGRAAHQARFGRPAGRSDIRPAPRPSRFRRPRRIAVVVPLTCPAFWNRVHNGVATARSVLEYHGTEVDWFGISQGLDEESLNSAVEQAIRSGYDAIGLVATTNRVCDAIWKATRKHVLVATFLADTSFGKETGSLFYHGASGFDLGQTAGQALAQEIQEPGRVAVLTSSSKVPDHEARRSGFEQYMRKYQEIELIGPFQHYESDDEIRGYLDYLIKDDSLRGVFVTTALSYVVAEVIESMGMADRIKVVGFDALPQTLPFLRCGTIVAAIDQDPFGQAYNSTVWLHNALMGKWSPAAYHIPPRIRTIAGVGGLVVRQSSYAG